MKSFGYVMAVLGVIALSFWVYQQNYATRDAISEARRVSAQIGAARERLAILQDEWAYLNRPARLRALVEANYTRLGLNPMLPDGFGAVEEVAFPPEPEAELVSEDATLPLPAAMHRGSFESSTGEAPL